MYTLVQITLTNGYRCVSASNEVNDTAFSMISSLVRAGGGQFGNLTIEIDRLQAEAAVFGLRYGSERAVQCWLACQPNRQLWQEALDDARTHYGVRGDTREPRAPWLAVALLPGCSQLDELALEELDKAEWSIAWALMRDLRPCGYCGAVPSTLVYCETGMIHACQRCKDPNKLFPNRCLIITRPLTWRDVAPQKSPDDTARVLPDGSLHISVEVRDRRINIVLPPDAWHLR